jgi:hypothetical protein
MKDIVTCNNWELTWCLVEFPILGFRIFHSQSSRRRWICTKRSALKGAHKMTCPSINLLHDFFLNTPNIILIYLSCPIDKLG